MNYEILYGNDYDRAKTQARYDGLQAQFQQCFPGENGRFFSSSGRVEVLGNHTDHNNGKVLVGAITVDTLAMVSPANDVEIYSEGYPKITLDLTDLTPSKTEYGTSYALVKGVIAAFKRRGLAVGGFHAVMNSTVFKGAGVSSSASYEVLVAEILNVFYNEEKISAVEKAACAQIAENEFFGKPCGLLDQTGIAVGSLSAIDFCNPAAPVVKSVTPDLKEYAIYIVNTGGDHADLTDAYASIRVEMGEVAAFFGKKVLREVDEKTFYEYMPTLQNAVSGRAILRAIHFFEENKRVDSGIAALENGDLAGFFAAVNASGESSWRQLQNAYVAGDTKQRIPLAIQLARSTMQNGGAVRLHGGGFAGTILCFVHAKDEEAFNARMQAVFGAPNVFRAGFRLVGATEVK